MQKDWQDIESQFQSALREQNLNSELSQNTSTIDKETIDVSHYSKNELLQLAYDKVEEEIQDINSELRELREKHRKEEERLERRLIQKTAFRQKIIDQARP